MEVPLDSFWYSLEGTLLFAFWSVFHGLMNKALALEDDGTLSSKAGRRWFLYLPEQCQPYQLERAALGGGQRNLSLWPCARQPSSHLLYYHCCFLFLTVCDSFGLTSRTELVEDLWGHVVVRYLKMYTFRQLASLWVWSDLE